MKMDVTNIENGITKVVLNGKLNVQGTYDVEPKFNELVKTADRVIVDMTDVSFLASMGMRILVASARSLRLKGGKLVLASPQADVEKTLKVTGVDTIVSIAPDLSSAIALFR
jgi:anti-anti-sigma factor